MRGWEPRSDLQKIDNRSFYLFVCVTDAPSERPSKNDRSIQKDKMNEVVRISTLISLLPSICKGQEDVALDISKRGCQAETA